MDDLTPIKRLLEAWFDDADAASLQRVSEQLKKSCINMADLLDWMERYRGDAERKSLAIRQVRAALGLALIPGPVCRR